MSAELIAHLLDLLRDTRWAGQIRARRMFGGHGVYVSDLFCALIENDVLYLKTDALNRAAFLARGLQPFTYRKQGEDLALSYYQAPAEALEDGDELADWLDLAAAAARRAVAAKSRPRKTRRLRKAGR